MKIENKLYSILFVDMCQELLSICLRSTPCDISRKENKLIVLILYYKHLMMIVDKDELIKDEVCTRRFYHMVTLVILQLY